MLRLGVIEPSISEWSDPVVLVIKKDGSICFCIDFRKVNAQSDFDACPLLRLDDLIECVGQAKFISTFDLCKSYWQLLRTDKAKPLTAFRTPQGLWQFTKMPFFASWCSCIISELDQYDFVRYGNILSIP